jgi:hypothetical protein
MEIWLAMACGPHTVDSDTETPPSSLQTRLGLCDGWTSDAIHGVDDLAPLDADADDARRLGLGLVRPHRSGGGPFAQNLIRLDGTTWDWSIPDHVVTAAQARELRVFATLSPVADPDGTPDHPIQPAVPTSEMPQWLDFVTRTVERYDGDGVDDMPGLTGPIFAYEVGNEPTCAPTDDHCASAYLDLLQQSYTTAKAASPDTLVLAAGAGPVFNPDGSTVHESTFGLYSWLFEHGAGDYTDAFDFHTLVGVANPSVDAYLNQWEQITGEQPLWLGEIGTRGPNDVPEVTLDPDEEARWLRNALDRAYAGGVERVLWCKAGDMQRMPEVQTTLADYASTL